MNDKTWLIKFNEVNVWYDPNIKMVCVDAPFNRNFVDERKLQLDSNLVYWHGASHTTRCRVDADPEQVKMFLQIVIDSYSVPDENVDHLMTFIPRVTFGKVRIVENQFTFTTNSYDANYVEDIKDTFNTTKEKIRWNASKKAWQLPVKKTTDVDKIIRFMKKWNLEPEGEFDEKFNIIKKKLVELNVETIDNIEISKKAKLDVDDEFVYDLRESLELFPFQEVGVKFISKNNGNCLIADQMGLGKTIQTLVYLYNNKNKLPVLVIAPSIAILNWYRETLKWIGLEENEMFVIKGKNGKYDDFMPEKRLVYFINYAVTGARLNELLDIGFKQLVVDESHYIKSGKSKRTKAILRLAKEIRSTICLSGTPILNRPKELWTTILVLRKSKYFGGNIIEYGKKFCDGYRGAYGWNFDGASNLDELQKLLRNNIMLRRTKKDVLPELPDKHRIVVPVEITNRREYKRAQESFRTWYYEETGQDVDKSAETLVMITALRKITSKGKIKSLSRFISNLYQNDRKVVVFFHHAHIYEKLLEDLKKSKEIKEEPPAFLRIIGSDTQKKKNENIDAFNNNKNAIIFCSITASGVAINLQTANTVVFAEVLWTPASIEQAEDRVHRIGQDEIVTIYYLSAEKTIEEWIWDKIETKQMITEEAIDGLDVGEDPIGMVSNIEDFFKLTDKWNESTGYH